MTSKYSKWYTFRRKRLCYKNHIKIWMIRTFSYVWRWFNSISIILRNKMINRFVWHESILGNFCKLLKIISWIKQTRNVYKKIELAQSIRTLNWSWWCINDFWFGVGTMIWSFPVDRIDGTLQWKWKRMSVVNRSACWFICFGIIKSVCDDKIQHSWIQTTRQKKTNWLQNSKSDRNSNDEKMYLRFWKP